MNKEKQKIKRCIFILICTMVLLGSTIIPVLAYTCGYHSDSTLSFSHIETGNFTSPSSTHCDGYVSRHHVYVCPRSDCSYWLKIYMGLGTNPSPSSPHSWGSNQICTKCNYSGL